MSVLVCMCNEPSHPHIYIQALTVRLFVSETAPWWLLFSPSRGVEGEVKIWEGEWGGVWLGRVWWGGVRSLSGVLPSGDPGGVAKRVPRRGGWTGDTAVNELSGQRLHKIHNGPNLSHWSDVSITWWRERRGGENRKADGQWDKIKLGLKEQLTAICINKTRFTKNYLLLF